MVAASLEASRPRLKPGTYAGYVHLYESRNLPTFGKQRIAAVTSQDVELLVGKLVAAGRASSTIHNHYVALNKVFRYAMRHRLITHNPCEAVELPKPGSREDFAAVFLTLPQVESIAAELDLWYPYGLLVRFAAYTGLRSGELAGLRVKDMDLAGNRVFVRQTIRRINGKWTVGTPKSKNSTREVPFARRSPVVDLREYLLTHPNSGDPDALLWPARSNGSRRLDYTRPIDCGGVRSYYLVPAAARLGIAAHMRFHDLRHTYASLMLAARFEPFEVARYLGHSGLVLLARTYGHMYATEPNAVADKFESYAQAQ
ncbi:tyrosine-type recombinase/integrase [Leifsonia sp. NPDC058230]|uniref:tyrosine-type recombinase/integrase n=1 Tax=Leifsonia sp. NPDC058230 TaxID=3346391 RepID=UPI0036DD1E58